MLRTNIEFSCDMPYDAVEGGGPDFIEMPGRTVVQAMTDILAGLGCSVDAVESAGDHGWFFWFKFRSAEVSCEVTAIDGIVAYFHGPDGYKPWFGDAVPPNSDYMEILDRFGEAIRADPRFRDLGWFNPDELTSGQVGARTPTGSYDPTPCKRTFGLAGRVDQGQVADVAAAEVSPTPDVASDGAWTPVRPWRRLAARMFDHFVIVGGPLVLVVYYMKIQPPALLVSINVSHYVKFFDIALGGAILNALCVRYASTTPGKWLCGMRVVGANGQPLNYAPALKREAEAILMGCAMFIMPPMLVTLAISFWRLISVGETAWDQRQGTVVLQAPASIRTRVATVSCLLSSYTMLYVLASVWPIH